MKTITLYLAILAISLPEILFGQTAWSRLTPDPQENTINCISKIPGTNILIAVAEGSTIMFSEDQGESWTINTNPAGKKNNFSIFSAYFLDEDIGFISGSKESILKTMDGGLTWEEVFFGGSMNSYGYNDFVFCNSTTGVAVGSAGKIIRTTDSGNSWQEVTTGVGFHLNAVDCCQPDRFVAVGSESDTILLSDNQGLTWEAHLINPPVSGGNLTDIKFVTNTIGFLTVSGAPNNQVLRTINAGDSWSIMYSGSYSPKAIDFYNDMRIAICCHRELYESGVLISTNNGLNWEECPFGEFSWNANKTIVVLDESMEFIMAGNMGMIFKSSDGMWWYNLYERTFWGDIYQVQFLDQNTGFALAENWTGGLLSSDLMMTTDGGSSWSNITGMANHNGASHFVNENFGFLTVNDFNLKVYKTTDGGQNWTVTDLEDYDFTPTCIRFYDELKGIICGDNQILVTSDGGVNWAEVYDDSFTNSYRDIEFRNEDEVYICGEDCTSSFVIKSEDGGNSWNYLYATNHIEVEDIYLYDQNTVFLVGYDAILKSTDGGESFIETTISNQNEIFFYSIYFPSEEIGFAVGHGQYETIVKSTDGGETWNAINSNSTSNLNAVHFFDENIGLVFGDNGVVLKTTTGGVTGFEETTGMSSISVFNAFPNPFNNEINIDMNFSDHWSDGLILIYDQSGKHIQDYEFCSLSGNLKIETGKLNSGVYFIQLITDNKLSETKKIIKL